MRRAVASILATAVATLAVPAIVHAGPGDLDPSFDGDGIVTTPFVDDSGIGALARQPDGKLVAAGYAPGLSGSAFALARYNPDGSLDGSFGVNGRVTTRFSSGQDLATSVAVQPDGRIVVAGIPDSQSSTSDFALARYNADGSLDTGFGSGGTTLTDIGGNDNARGLALQPDGKIVVAGISFTPDDADMVVARYDQDGSLDPSFDGNGKQGIEFGGDDAGFDAAVQPDGRIVIAGFASVQGPVLFAVSRLNPDGSIDTSFSDDGRQTVEIPPASWAAAVAIQPDGKIVASGTAFPPSGPDFAVARLNPDGSPDGGFNGVGFLTTDFGGFEFGSDMALQPDGKIVAAGSTEVGGVLNFALARYNADGSPDPSFGPNGRVATQIADGGNLSTGGGASSVIVQPDGKLVAAGLALSGERLDFALARYGTTDDGGGGGGGSGGGGGGGATDTTAPTCSAEPARAKAGKPLQIELACDEGANVAAAGKIVARQKKANRSGRAPSAAKKLKVPLKPAATAISAGETQSLTLKPKGKKRKAKRKLRALRNAVKRGAKAKAKLTLTGVDASGNQQSNSLKIKIGR